MLPTDPTPLPGSDAPRTVHRHRVAADVAAIPPLRERFLAFAADVGVPPASLTGWALVFNEAVTNAIVHGCGACRHLEVVIEWWKEGAELCLAIDDPGGGPPAELAANPTLPDDPLAESGRGLFIIHEFSDDHQHWSAPGTGYRQVVRKRYPHLNAPLHNDPSSASDLDQILDELSSAYECMSAFHRFGSALVGAAGARDLVTKAVESLAMVQSPSPDLVLVCLSDKVFPAIQNALRELPCVVARDAAPARARAVLDDGKSVFWESPEEADDPALRLFESGCCFPIVASGATLGCLVTAHRHREIGLRPTELSTLRTFSDLLGMALANSNLQVIRDNEQRALHELELATTIQKNLLTIPRPPRSPLWHLTLRHRSATEVAGDYLEAHLDPDGYLVLTVIDVMGKGVSAAMLATMFRTLLHRELRKTRPLDELIHSLNRSLVAQLENVTTFITCAMVRISPDLRTAEATNAGHCPILALNAGGLYRQIEPTGPPLGLFDDAVYPVQTIPLGGDEAFLMVTDGLYEWEVDNEGWWGWDNLVQLAAAEAHRDADSFWSQLQAIIRAHNPRRPPKDDQTMLFWKNLSVPLHHRGDPSASTPRHHRYDTVPLPS
ncbi:hypothetical protein BH23VER1_BH23VER1_36820 [soil metagenome]